ncbi:MAG: HD domain-containing protein, partial [Treponema sp.]|nr:HD domain-containing protein [Treponema sp.]
LYIIIGSLLHDAGMLRLPKEIMEKRGGLTETERQRMRSHPLFSQRMVTKEMNYPEEVGEIVLQHHERWDGEGYPYHFPGEKIDIGARIVSIADAFEAMVSPKPYRNSIVGYQAMKNLLADNSRRFDPDILKAFILTMGIYPIGSIVLLNNGVIARVSEARANAPLRPRIQIIIDEYKKIYKNEEGIIIDLLIEKNLYITKAMETSELLGLYA